MPRKLVLLATAVFAVVSALAVNAEAMVTPVGVSLFPPFEFPLRQSSIVGARLNLFIGVHQSVYGFDLGGVGNMTSRAFGGIQLAGVFNRNVGPASIYGLQLAGLVNWNLNRSEIYGVQLALGLNVNHGRSTFVGVGIGGLGNHTVGTVVGAQIGLYNQARQLFGFQLGLVNVTKSLHGVQLGLINVNQDGPLPFFPVVNMAF